MASDAALRVTAMVLEAVELTGIWPTQVSVTTMPMIPKPKGGFRVIGLLPALYRLWGRARREHAVRWENEHLRGYFASAAGTSPVDVVWAQAARQEAGVAGAQTAGMVLEDLASLYEGINRDVLADEAMALGFPLPLIRACYAAYSGPRMVALHGRLAKETHPRQGIIAGCPFATSLIKVFMLRAIDRAKERLPIDVAVDIYIDDVAISTFGSNEEVARKLTLAYDIICTALVEELGCTFAGDKTAVIATDKEVTRKLKEHLGVAGMVKDAVPNLGIDATAGRRRGTSRTGTVRGGQTGSGLPARPKACQAALRYWEQGDEGVSCWS